MITRYGIEGGAVYALSSVLREALATTNPITLEVDLRPDLSQQQIASRLARPQGKDSSRQLSAQIHRSFADGNQPPARERHAT